MRIFILSLLLIFTWSCTKPYRTGSEEQITNYVWLSQQKQALDNCTCLTAIYQGTYQAQTIYEIRVIDPLCNGINSVFYVDGSPLVNSSQQSAYAAYIAGVQNLQQIWKCK